MKNLDILNKNLNGTNFSNARWQDGKLIATHYGSIWVFPNLQLEGTNDIQIYPSISLLERVTNCGFDQNGFVTQELDWRAL